MTKRYELTDQQWNQIRDLFERAERGRPARDPRKLWNGIFWVMWSGSPWRDLPERYGYWNNVYQRFIYYQRSGKLDEVLRRLNLSLTPDNRLDVTQYERSASAGTGPAPRRKYRLDLDGSDVGEGDEEPQSAPS